MNCFVKVEFVRSSRIEVNLIAFLDVNNLFHGCRHKFGGNVDYIKVHEEVLKHGDMIQGIAYGHADKSKGLPYFLSKLGYLPKWLPNYNVNVTLAMDLAELMPSGIGAKDVVFVSNDLNLIPCVEHAIKHGARVHTIGFRLQRLTKKLSTSFLELNESHLLVRKDNDTRTDPPIEQLVMPSGGLLTSPEQIPF